MLTRFTISSLRFQNVLVNNDQIDDRCHCRLDKFFYNTMNAILKEKTIIDLTQVVSLNSSFGGVKRMYKS